MKLEICLTLLVILLTLVAFIREWATPDVLALSILCLLVALDLVDAEMMTDVFKNEAPITIAALFVIGGALLATGAVDQIGNVLKRHLSGNIRWAIFALTIVPAAISAFMNNTAVVAIFLPVALGLGRSKNIPASSLLIPLSYASIFGGCCTLIGTSTNLLVSGTLRDLGREPLSMFELAPIGVPLTLAGILYLVIFGPKLLPARSSISGSLKIEQRSTVLYHLLINKKSLLVGKRLVETVLAERGSGVRILEVRRSGARVKKALSDITIEKNDRYLVAHNGRKKPEELFEEIGAEVLSTVDGLISELVVHDESSLIGVTMAASDFRQRYNCVVLAVHRSGQNITEHIADLPLENGDTLLVVTARHNLEFLEASRDFVMTDSSEELSPQEVVQHRPKLVILTWSVMGAVILAATLSETLHRFIPSIPIIPIHFAAMVGALALVWLKVVTPREAYASIDWQVLFMLYGLLGLGMAIQSTGTAVWLANNLVLVAESIVSKESIPMVMLWLIFLLTMLLTEVLSNNATAVIMVPIAITIAINLGVNPRPYVIAATLASSCAFSLPMGYQTHMMVFGPGGYRFSDFLRIGLPLNLIFFVIACLLIPLIFPLKLN